MADLNTESAPLPPGSTIGILGGGQLGRMLSQAATRLGFKTHIYCPDEKSPAGEVASKWTRADYMDFEAVAKFTMAVDVVTYEWENIPVECADAVTEAGGDLFPGRRALEVAQDRLSEKRYLKSLAIDTAPFMPVASDEALGMAINVAGLPAILKTRRFGYDGKGQSVIHDEDDASIAWEAMDGTPAIMEGFVPFEREISVILARSAYETCLYDPAENEHRDGVLRRSTVPASISKSVCDEAGFIACKIAEDLDYIGVLAVEFFVENSGHLRVNEIAPRVHNSGHWTIEACRMSQFEAHIRAIAGWPLGTTKRHSDAMMQNLIGEEATHWLDHVKNSDASLTLYGKKVKREGRKMGHVTYLKPRSD